MRVLGNWVRPRKLGRVTASGAGFILPNTNLRAPNVSFVVASRLRQAPQGYAQIVPDLVVEVKSPSDQLSRLRSKIQEFLSLGTQVGMLVDPVARVVEVYRPNTPKELLGSEDILTLPDLLPRFAVAIAQLWSPEF